MSGKEKLFKSKHAENIHKRSDNCKNIKKKPYEHSYEPIRSCQEQKEHNCQDGQSKKLLTEMKGIAYLLRAFN